MGKHFGNLQRLKGVIYYSLAPDEIHPFRGFFNPGFINNVKRLSRDMVTMLPGGILTVLFYIKINEISEAEMRKNPADYENEV